MFETLKEYVKKTKGYDLSFDSIKEKGLCYIKIYCESYKRIDNVIYRDVPKILQESIRIHNLKIKGVIK